MKNNRSTHFQRTKKRIEQIKGFYRHLTFYILINTVLLIGKTNVFGFFAERGVVDQGFFDWLNWNIVLTPILWGVGLLIHGLYVFKDKSISIRQLKPKALRDWEENQIQKYMEEEDRTAGKY